MCQNGAVTVRQEGPHAICQAISRTGKSGLYKAWLIGAGGRALLGTLIPEGGVLRLRRTMDIGQLESLGAWPPSEAEIVLAYALMPDSQPPAGWCWTECPGKLLEEPIFRNILRGTRRSLIRRVPDGFLLAFPHSERRPFPIPPLFCLSQIERLGDKPYVIFRFSGRGKPELLYNFSVLGNNSIEA